MHKARERSRAFVYSVAAHHIDGMDTSPSAVWSALSGWPLGYFTATCAGRRYGVTRTVLSAGRSMKLWAEELGGNDRISLNIYAPPSGDPTLKPCEMPIDKVTAFVLGARPEPSAAPAH
jgi:hypothetical protein